MKSKFRIYEMRPTLEPAPQTRLIFVTRGLVNWMIDHGDLEVSRQSDTDDGEGRDDYAIVDDEVSNEEAEEIAPNGYHALRKDIAEEIWAVYVNATSRKRLYQLY